MKRCIIIFNLILCFSYNCFATGPPVVPDGTITVDHIVLKLSAKQLSKVEKFRLLELNENQTSFLRIISKSFPKIIPVLTPYYRGCTCDVTYVIWNKQNEVGIPIHMLNYLDKYFSIEGTKNYFGEQVKSWTKNELVLDNNGNVFWNGTKLTNTEIINIVKKKKLINDQFKRVLLINRPPTISTETENKIETIIKFIEKIGKENKVSIYIVG